MPISCNFVCLYSLKKQLKLLVQQDLWIRNSILLAFVLTSQFIAIRAKNKTYIICKIDRPGNLGEPLISDRTVVRYKVITRTAVVV